MEDIISAERVVFGYPKEDNQLNIVLRGVSLTIPEGQFVAVLGHNGSGKSTLAKHFNAILVPNEGKVTVCGIDTTDENKLYDIRQQVGMVFQNPDNQIVSNVVEEDVAFAPENLGVPTQEIRRRVDEALEAVGMAAYKKHAPHLLSGGQKQRVAIAGVLAMRPKTIVLDEPTAMLDPQGRQEVVSIVEKLSREQNITVILITHHMDEAICADRVIAMDDGKIIADGAPKDVFTKIDLLQSVGLTAPQTTLLLKALDDDGCALPLDALSVDDCAQALLRQILQAKA